MITELEQKLNYRFKNQELLRNALTHSSYANEEHCKFGSNERLEFLGDSVLSIIVSEYIYKNFKNLPEGELTKLRASLVCEKALSGFSRELELGRFLYLGKGESHNHGEERPSILADAFEAVLAAIYLDVAYLDDYENGTIPEFKGKFKKRSAETLWVTRKG